MKCSLGICNFLEEISSLSHFNFFLFACIVHLGTFYYLSLLLFGTLHSNGCIFLFSFAFCFPSFLSYLLGLQRHSRFTFSPFFFLVMVLITASCTMSWTSIHRILQARILERVAISFSKGSSWPRDWTQVSHIAGRRFNLCATRGKKVDRSYL